MYTPEGANVVEDGIGLRGQHWLELMEEAGVSPARRRRHARLWLVLMLLTVAAIALSVVSIFVGGGTMRCLIDRTNSFNVLRVFPYAQPDAKLPSGRMLKFHRA
jgi:hypothetical protein